MDLNHPKLGLYNEVKTLEATLARQAKLVSRRSP